MLIKSIKPISGYPAQIDSSGTKPANRNTFSDKTFKNLQGAVFVIQVYIWKTGYKAGLDNMMFIAYRDGLIIQCGAFSFFRKKKFIDMWVENGPHDHFPFFFNCYRNAVERNAMGKIHRAVNRINDPFIFGFLSDLANLF